MAGAGTVQWGGAAGPTLTAAERDRYLGVLGVQRREPSLDALAELTAAHLTRVPFENLSKLLRFRRDGFRGIPELESFLDGIERFGFGGTCYSNNFHLFRLLGALGYEVSLCGADMSQPDVHIANVVRLEGREFLVDAGYGAPFLDPMPLDLDREHVIALGGERYVLRPRDCAARSRLELHRNGRQTHGYLLNPAPRRIEEFGRVIESSFAPTATFMNALAIVRFRAGGSLVLHNLSLVESEGASFRVRRLAGLAALPGVIEEHFGIPGSLALEALAGMPLTHDPWG